MNLGYLGKLLFDGEVEKFKKELLKMPIAYEDIWVISMLLNTLEDDLSLTYKLIHSESKEKRLAELLERLEESIKIASITSRETDKGIIKRNKQLIELLGAAIGFRFPGERFLG